MIFLGSLPSFPSAFKANHRINRRIGSGLWVWSLRWWQPSPCR